ncbi:T9SS type A sorting domain-containing protein [Formosa sp. A9]|uniref:T9SS type A sorting domain-containing protein n=1 Tax=Formosa sp. A9 TaxID=3442641 RepID=UPI003EBDD720
MKRKILLITLITFHIQIFSQDLLTPINKESFGLNNHTNRDISYFSNLDSNKNTIIVGTTEKDSTFTDIITTKLDNKLNLVWQKHLSINTDLSYDIPIKSFINSHNELYILGRSSFNRSNSNGLVFVAKYSEEGELMFTKTIGNIDGSDYVDYRYLDAELNEDDTLNLVYAPVENQSEQSNKFIFLKISNQGDILNSFNLEIKQHGVKGIIKDEKYYFLISEFNETDFTYSYKFYKIQNENNISVIEITDSTFLDCINYAVITKDVKLNIDNEENCYLTCHNVLKKDSNKNINLSKIDNSNTFVYSTNTSDTENYFLIGSFINAQNKIIVVANNLNTDSIDFISVDENNLLQTRTNTDSYLGTGFKENEDNTFFITTSNSNIRLFSNELTEVKSFNTSNSYQLVDFLKIDEQSISTIGTSFEKMFPDSDYFTQLDIHSEKLNDTQVLHNYLFSGIGTSSAFQQRVIIDNENNYLVLVTEKMGPEYLGIGGTNPPLNKRIIKYDSNLNKLWESEVPEHIFNLINHGGRDIIFFIDSSNNLYLNLPRKGDTYGLGYSLYKVNPKGDFEFINTSHIADKFYANENSIYLAHNYFLYEDSSKLYVLDKNNGNLKEEIDVGHEEFLDIFSIGDDIYFYTYEAISNNSPELIYLYKNGVKINTKNLPRNFGMYRYEIDNDGTLFFATEYGGDRRLNKIDINNSYSYYNTSDEIIKFKRFTNGNIFLYLDDNSTLILDENLNFITNGDTFDSPNPHLMAYENYLLFGTAFENSVRVINDNGEVINYFSVEGSLNNWYSQIDNQGNLILTGKSGNKIYTFNEYSWFRGFIHNYGNLSSILNIDDFTIGNVENDLRLYPNPTSNILNIKTNNKIIDKIILYDISGQKIKAYYKSPINLKELKTGLYIIKIYTDSGEALTSKVIKM